MKGEFLEYLGDYYFLKKNCAYRNWMAAEDVFTALSMCNCPLPDTVRLERSRMRSRSKVPCVCTAGMFNQEYYSCFKSFMCASYFRTSLAARRMIRVFCLARLLNS
jgi:hypothetical protein